MSRAERSIEELARTLYAALARGDDDELWSGRDGCLTALWQLTDTVRWRDAL
jgi:hypothetical protein